MSGFCTILRDFHSKVRDVFAMREQSRAVGNFAIFREIVIENRKNREIYIDNREKSRNF